MEASAEAAARCGRGRRDDHAGPGWVVGQVRPAPRRPDQQLPPSERLVAASDVLRDFEWADPAAALSETWIDTYPGLMRGAGTTVPEMSIGDLVFAMRIGWLDADPAVLRRPTVIGVWWIEAILDVPLVMTSAGRCGSARCTASRSVDSTSQYRPGKPAMSTESSPASAPYVTGRG